MNEYTLEELNFMLSKFKVATMKDATNPMWTTLLLKTQLKIEEIKDGNSYCGEYMKSAKYNDKLEYIDAKIDYMIKNHNYNTADLMSIFITNINNNMKLKFEIKYTDSKGVKSTRVIAPTELSNGKVTAYCEKAQAIRQFKLDSISYIEVQ